MSGWIAASRFQERKLEAFGLWTESSFPMCDVGRQSERADQQYEIDGAGSTSSTKTSRRHAQPYPQNGSKQIDQHV